ncbi:MAG: hypothetical protein ACT4NY_04350 [Pseudonocardiales bacterium]
MPVGADDTAGLEPVGSDQHEALMFEAGDLADAAPMCTEAEFGAVVNDLVAAEAPRLFSCRPHVTAHVGWVKPAHPVLDTES